MTRCLGDSGNIHRVAISEENSSQDNRWRNCIPGFEFPAEWELVFGK
jgi:hypothetical protein